MVLLSEELDRRRLLSALDETPQTVERLARRLDEEPEAVRAALEKAREADMVVDWGNVWATTWRAKLVLSPAFFRVWIPVSLALGAVLTAIALALNAPESVRWKAAAAMLVLALVAALLAWFPWIEGTEAS